MIRKICSRSRGMMPPTSHVSVASKHGASINQISSLRLAPLLLAITTINLKMSILLRVVIVNDVISQHLSLLALRRRAVWHAPSSPLQSINLQLLISTCGILLVHPHLPQTQIKELMIIRVIVLQTKSQAAVSKTQTKIIQIAIVEC